jgi:hypothetical protein
VQSEEVCDRYMHHLTGLGPRIPRRGYIDVNEFTLVK